MNATEGDTVTIQVEASVTEAFEDGSLTVDADGVEMPVYPDEVVRVDD